MGTRVCRSLRICRCASRVRARNSRAYRRNQTFRAVLRIHLSGVGGRRCGTGYVIALRRNSAYVRVQA